MKRSLAVIALAFGLCTACTAPETPITLDEPELAMPLDDKKKSGAAKAAPAPTRFKGAVATREEGAACAAAGGKVMRGGLAGHEQCVISYADAGAPCTDSSQCEGKCYVVGEYPGIGEATSAGQCQPTSSPFGCRTEVTDGKAGGMLCVD